MDSTFSWFGGLATFPLLPSAQTGEDEEGEGVPENIRETAKEREERKSDFDVARQDVVKAKTEKLPRYLLCSTPSWGCSTHEGRMNFALLCVSGFAKDKTTP